MKHYGHIDLNRNLLQNAVLPTDSNFPATPIPGMLVFKNKKMYICTEIAAGLPVWVPMTQEIDSFIYTQAAGATAWVIPHNLNTASVFVQVYDAAGLMILPDYIDASVFNQVTVMFSSTQIGKAVVMTGSQTGSPRALVAYTQAYVDQAVWVVPHGLGYYPEMSVYIGGQMVQPMSIVNDSTTQATITFSTAHSGLVRCV